MAQAGLVWSGLHIKAKWCDPVPRSQGWRPAANRISRPIASPYGVESGFGTLGYECGPAGQKRNKFKRLIRRWRGGLTNWAVAGRLLGARTTPKTAEKESRRHVQYGLPDGEH